MIFSYVRYECRALSSLIGLAIGSFLTAMLKKLSFTISREMLVAIK